MRHAFFYILTLFLVPALFSCTEEKLIPSPEPDEGKQITVYFNSVSPSTYALDFEQEAEVRTIDVLAFKIDGNLAAYAYRKEVKDEDIESAEFDENNKLYKKKFKVELTNDGSQYIYVFIVNAKTEVSACLNNNQSIVDKDFLLSHLIASNTDVWNTGNNYKLIPMWGEFGPATPKSLDGETIELMRAVARVDIRVSVSDFIISEVYVKNQYNHGCIVPSPSNWVASPEKKAIAPTIPSSGDYTGNLINTNALKYAPSATTGGTISGSSVSRSIYLFETELPSDNNYINTTHLIIKGTKTGFSDTYYRADFKDVFAGTPENNDNDWDDGPPGSGSGSGGMVGAGNPYRKLLRNHHYVMNIISVAGEGYSNLSLASSNTDSQNMLVEHINWNDQRNDINVGNTSYSFDISRAKVPFNSSHTHDYILIKTNFPGEWVIDKLASNTWFTVEKKNDDTIEIIFTGTPTTNYSGSFDILLKNGNEVKFTKKIQVDYTK